MKKNILIDPKITIPLILAIISGTWYAVYHFSIAPRDFEIDALRKNLKQSAEVDSGYQIKIESLEVKIEWLNARIDLEKARLNQKEGKQAVQRSPGAIQSDRDGNFSHQPEKGIEPVLMDSLIFLSIEGTIGYNMFLQYPDSKVLLMAKWIKEWEGKADAILFKGSKEDLFQFRSTPRSSRLFFNRSIHYVNWMNRLKFKIEALNRIITKKKY